MSSSQINGFAADLSRRDWAIVEEQRGPLPGDVSRTSFKQTAA